MRPKHEYVYNKEENKVICTTSLNGEVVVTITLDLELLGTNPALRSLRVKDIKTKSGYERSNHKYNLIGYIITKFDEICEKFEYDREYPITKLLIPNYDNDELLIYKEMFSMNVSGINDELFTVATERMPRKYRIKK